MISMYKRFVLWNTSVLARIPGYRTYGRWMHKQYTQRFWTTWFINFAVSMGTYFGFVWWMRRQQEKLEATISSTPVQDYTSPTKIITDGILNPSFDHMK